MLDHSLESAEECPLTSPTDTTPQAAEALQDTDAPTERAGAQFDDEVDAAGAAESAEGGEEAQPSNRLPEIPIAEVQSVTSREDLDRILAAHQQWIAAVLDPKAAPAAGRANLAGADLRGYSLAGVNLSGANLAGANLAGCDLSGANLSAANLTGAVLATASLVRTRLRGAKIDGMDLRGADLTDAVLTGLDLGKAVLKSPETATHSEPVPEIAARTAPEAASDSPAV